MANGNRSTARIVSIGVVSALLLGVFPIGARAQLISDEVRGDQRVCSYYGSDTLPNDEVVARTLSIGLGQNCPATAPYHDPNAPVPANARLLRDSATGSKRVCIYEQGGVQYQVPVAITVSCAMTPALNNPDARP